MRMLLIASISLACLAACSPAKEAPTPLPEAVDAKPAARLASAITLPVSINATMVALVDHASEPLWVDAYQPPKTEAGWREAEHHAYQLAIVGKLIQLAGTGPNDNEWVANPDWIRMADEMSSAGMEALAAAKSRDTAALNLAGDRLVASCESCHKQFKPDLPSMGIYKSPDYPPKPN